MRGARPLPLSLIPLFFLGFTAYILLYMHDPRLGGFICYRAMYGLLYESKFHKDPVTEVARPLLLFRACTTTHWQFLLSHFVFSHLGRPARLVVSSSDEDRPTLEEGRREDPCSRCRGSCCTCTEDGRVGSPHQLSLLPFFHSLFP